MIVLVILSWSQMKTKFNCGFTLVETLVTFFISTIVITLTGLTFSQIIGTNDFILDQAATLSAARGSIQQLAREIREAQSSEEGAYALESAEDFEISFYSDVDNDDRIELVRYYLDSNELWRGVIEPSDDPPTYPSENENLRLISQAVVNQIDQPLFYYYNSDWPADTENNPLPESERLLNARLIEVSLLINTHPEEQQSVVVKTTALMRNLISTIN